MPPKIKTDRQAVLDAAFAVTQSEGLAAVTAQSVSVMLKTSVAPIFRKIQTIEELRTATAEKISVFHTAYLRNTNGAPQNPPAVPPHSCGFYTSAPPLWLFASVAGWILRQERVSSLSVDVGQFLWALALRDSITLPNKALWGNLHQADRIPQLDAFQQLRFDCAAPCLFQQPPPNA